MFFGKKWEYTTVNIKVDSNSDNVLDMTTALNKKGQQGFELVQVIFERDVKQFLFKKQIWNESDKLYSNGVCLNKSLSVLFMWTI